MARLAVNEEIEAIAQMIEHEKGWQFVDENIPYEDSIDRDATKKSIAAAIRARKK